MAEYESLLQIATMEAGKKYMIHKRHGQVFDNSLVYILDYVIILLRHADVLF